MADDHLDDLLDQALASYSAAEPLTGLEDRVLARVHSAPVPRRTWIWALAAVLGGLVFITWLQQPVAHPAAVQARQRHAVLKQPEPVRVRVSARRRVRKARVSPQQLTQPQLTQDEILLARFVASDPEAAVKAFQSLNESMQREVTLKPLVLEPIRIESLQ